MYFSGGKKKVTELETRIQNISSNGIWICIQVKSVHKKRLEWILELQLLAFAAVIVATHGCKMSSAVTDCNFLCFIYCFCYSRLL